MNTIDSHYLSEVVECADVAVRTASQLRKLSKGYPIDDHEAIEMAVSFIGEARAGGVFMDVGQSLGIQASLKPLNWAADVFFKEPTVAVEAPAANVDYSQLCDFLDEIRSTLERVQSTASIPDDEAIRTCIRFFESLGQILGSRADQSFRSTSSPFGDWATLL